MHVRQIDTTNKKDVARFIQFPFTLYKEDPLWVPPMVNDVRFAFNRAEHPFYKHSDAAFFLAEDQGTVVGRIAVIDNERYKAHTNSKTGFFYFFETVEIPEAAEALFETAFAWARSRGLESIIGPKGLAQGDGLGMLVKGFEYKPAIGIAYNPAYYAQYIEHAGFEKEVDYHSGFLTKEYQLPERVQQLAERVKKRGGFWVKQFESKDEMREWVPRIREVYNKAFVVVPNFVPLTEDEIQMVANHILSIADPGLIKLIFKKDELIGFLFAYHNISEGLQKARGKMFPFGWFHLMRAFKTTKWVDLNGIGLLPGHQGVGATAVLYTEIFNSVLGYGFEYGDVVQIAESNMKSFGEISNMGVNWHKLHRVYKCNLRKEIIR